MDRDRLLDLVKACISRGEVTLASGAKSDFYVDGRLVTLSPEGSALIGEAVLAHASELGATVIGGPTTGACPMVSAAGVLAAQQGVPVKLCYVRAAAKGHGMGKVVEGPPLTAEDKLLMVDDVMTSGGSLLRAIEQVQQTGCEVIGAFCVVDRQAGGREKVEAAGIRFDSVFTREELS